MRYLSVLQTSAVLAFSGFAAILPTPAQAQQVILTPGGTMLVSPMPSESLPSDPNPPVIPTPSPESPQSDQDFLQSPIAAQARREQMKLIVSNPEIYSLNPTTWGKPVKDVVDAQGNVIMTKQDIMQYRSDYAQTVLNGQARAAVWTRNDQYEALGFIPDTIDQVNSGIYAGRDIQDQARFYRQLIADRNITPDSGATAMAASVNAPGAFGLVQAASAPVTSSILSASGSTNVFSAAALPATIAPATITPTATPIATVQASQNPAADFAAAKGFDRARMPQQLNRQILDSPLSSSRIFPGMR